MPGSIVAAVYAPLGASRSSWAADTGASGWSWPLTASALILQAPLAAVLAEGSQVITCSPRLTRLQYTLVFSERLQAGRKCLKGSQAAGSAQPPLTLAAVSEQEAALVKCAQASSTGKPQPLCARAAHTNPGCSESAHLCGKGKAALTFIYYPPQNSLC